MSRPSFLGGMGMGVITGAALGMAFMTQKMPTKRAAGKAVRTAGKTLEELVENLTTAMGR